MTPYRLAVSSGLGGTAAGWVLAGVFASGWARALAVLAAGLGAGAAALAARWRENGLAAYLPLPVAAVAGWLAMWPDTAGPNLVVEALRSGGISQPPVAFDPGWRFLLVAVTVLVASLSVALGQPRLAPLPGAAVVLLGVLVQPDGGAVTAVVGGLVFLGAALAVAVGGEEGAAEFEARRLARGGGALVGVVAVLVVLSQFGFLFPPSNDDQVIPPKRPEVPPSVPDRVLFTVQADRPVPLRLGVLDVYDGLGFLTPPFDTKRFDRLPTKALADGITATITVEDLGGHVLPGVAEPAAVVNTKSKVEVDPRTGQLRLPKSRARKGLRYTVVGAAVPTAEALEAAPPAQGLDEFTEAPPPPPVVAELLAAAPTSSYARLQYLRTQLYSRVVAAGAGNPVDVPPARVGELLEGKEASPWEITAAEVLLARWAGVPARLGYGYYDPTGNGEIRPRNGATWLEAYFQGSGWVPITGSPPRAKSSFNREPKKQDPLVRATDELALVVLVPVRRTTVQLLYTQVRYWAVRLLPAALAAGLVWATVPWALRALRRGRRRRWARSPASRLLVAYAEFRDASTDLNIGTLDATPLELLDAVEPDDEHAQLAWLVTRGLWGDLRRDLSDDDVQAGEDMAASVLRRLRRAQPAATRVGAFVSRASLRTPWSAEVPRVTLRWRPVAAAPVLLLVAALAAPAGGQPPSPPSPPVPSNVDGVELRREPTVEEAFGQAGKSSIVASGQVYSLRRGDDVEGSLQIGAFVAGVDANDDEVRRAVVKSIGRGQLRLTRIGRLRAYALDLPEQRMLLWFPPDGRSYELLITRSTFDVADRVLTSVVAHQQGGGAAGPERPDVPVPDPRRGAPR